MNGDEKLGMLSFKSDVVSSISWSSEGDRIAAGTGNSELSSSASGCVMIWDMYSAEAYAELRGHRRAVTCVAWSPQGRFVASSSLDTNVIIWNVKQKMAVITLRGHNDWVNSIAWNPSGDRLVSGSYDTTLVLWNAETGSVISVVGGDTGRILSISWSPNGKTIAAGLSDGTIKVSKNCEGFNQRPQVLNIRLLLSVLLCIGAAVPSLRGFQQLLSDRIRSTVLFDFNSYMDPFLECASSCFAAAAGILFLALLRLRSAGKGSTRSRAAAAAPGPARTVGTAAPHGRFSLSPTHRRPVTCVAYSPAGNRVAAAAAGDGVVILDADSGARAGGCAAGGRVRCVAWGPDGRRLADRKSVV